MIRSTATLACVGRRQNYFREEFLSALEILQRGDVKPDRLARLLGRRFRPDPIHADRVQALSRWTSTATAAATWSTIPPISIASTANNLKKDGWLTGQTWGYEVVVPAAFNYMLADRAASLTIREWERLGHHTPGNKPFPHADDRAYLLVAGRRRRGRAS